MNNVVNLRLGQNQLTPFEIARKRNFEERGGKSPCDFEVAECNVYSNLNNGTMNPDYKQLYRTDNSDLLPIVGSKYKVMNNRDVFHTFEDGLAKNLEPHIIEGVEIRDEVAYNGTDSYRHYIFPALRCDVDEQSRVAFRAVVSNSFGKSALRMHIGAIDFFCSNGIVTGEFDMVSQKHTKSLNMDKFIEHAVISMSTFSVMGNRVWRKWRETKVTNDQMFAYFAKQVEDGKLSKRLATSLIHQTEDEAASRGGLTMWAVYSALTNYASHADGRFTLRDTGKDTRATVMFDRQSQVRRLATHDDFLLMAA